MNTLLGSKWFSDWNGDETRKLSYGSSTLMICLSEQTTSLTNVNTNYQLFINETAGNLIVIGAIMLMHKLNNFTMLEVPKLLRSDCLYDTMGSAKDCDLSVSRWTNPRSVVVGFSQP